VDAVDEPHIMEVDEKSQWNIHEPHIAEKLRFVNGKNLRDRFKLNDQTIIDQHVESKRFFESVALVIDRNCYLLCGGNVLKEKFSHQTFLVDRFQQAGTLEAMHLNGRAYHPMAEFISTLKFRMHGDFGK